MKTLILTISEEKALKEILDLAIKSYVAADEQLSKMSNAMEMMLNFIPDHLLTSDQIRRKQEVIHLKDEQEKENKDSYDALISILGKLSIGSNSNN